MVTIQNDLLTLSVKERGAEMMHLQYKGKEYLWQGDPKYWDERSPILFPFVGRLIEKRYRLNGKEYPLGLHGFAAGLDFTVTERTDDLLTMTLQNSPETEAQYPFAFTFSVTFRLMGNTLETTYTVENKSDAVMPFGLGGHPGFQVPLNEGEAFDDYYLEFSHSCQPDRVGLTPAVFLSGHDVLYPLEKGTVLPLRHDLFNDDAIVLKNMAREVTLRSKKSGDRVTVSYPQMPYIGFWHRPETDAPYVCIEPWTSLPGRQDVIEDLGCKSDLVLLPPGKVYQNTWRITITQE